MASAINGVSAMIVPVSMTKVPRRSRVAAEDTYEKIRANITTWNKGKVIMSKQNGVRWS